MTTACLYLAKRFHSYMGKAFRSRQPRCSYRLLSFSTLNSVDIHGTRPRIARKATLRWEGSSDNIMNSLTREQVPRPFGQNWRARTACTTSRPHCPHFSTTQSRVPSTKFMRAIDHRWKLSWMYSGVLTLDENLRSQMGILDIRWKHRFYVEPSILYEALDTPIGG